MNDKLLESNLHFMEQSNPDFLRIKGIDLARAKEKAQAASLRNELQHWNEMSKRAVHLPNQLPRNDESFLFVESTVGRFDLNTSIEPIINEQADVTLWNFILEIKKDIISCGFDPYKTVTSMGTGGIGLIALGTGSGELLNQQIETFKPYRVSILVSDWNDYASSFWILDWKELYSKCTSNGTELSVTKVSSKEHLLATLHRQGLIWLDHAYIYESPVCDDKLKEWKDILFSNELSNLVHYLGYTVDEYNMTVQSMLSLKKGPRVFMKPLKPVGGRFIMCGSGPSLDTSLSYLRDLQETHTIVCGGSSYKALKDAGVRVDYLTLMERDYEVGNDDYKGYHACKGIKGNETRLIMADVCWHELMDTFEDTCVFFRSALTPLSLFSTSPREVLGFEGPEAVNAGASFCAALGAEYVILIGVDLGSVDQGNTRSNRVLGKSSRVFDIKTEANFGGEAFTCTSMLNVRQVLEALIVSSSHKVNADLGTSGFSTRFINCSNGVKIRGTDAISISEYAGIVCNNAKYEHKVADMWWNSLRRYSRSLLGTQWEARNPRAHTFSVCRELEALYSGNDIFYPNVLEKTEALMSLDCPIGQQFPRRVMRGTILKAVLAVSQQMQIMRGARDVDVSSFGAIARQRLVFLTKELEHQIYLLLDYVENNFLLES